MSPLPPETGSLPPAIEGPLLEDVRLLADKVIEATTNDRGEARYRVAGVAMAWCASLAEAVKVASILARMPRRAGISPG